MKLAMIVLAASAKPFFRSASRTLRHSLGARMAADESFAILGLSTNATLEDIRMAYRSKALVLHPDVSDLPVDRADQQFQRLVCAAQEARLLVKSMPRLNPPAGLSAAKRFAWLLAENKVLCFIHGTEEAPLDDASSTMLAALSSITLDKGTRFAAVNVGMDQELGEVVAKHAKMGGPVCYIDRQCIGGAAKLEEYCVKEDFCHDEMCDEEYCQEEYCQEELCYED